MTLFALYSNAAVSASIYHFLHPVQHKQLVALKEQGFNRNYFLGGGKDNDCSCSGRFLVTCSFLELMESGAAHLAEGTQQCRRSSVPHHMPHIQL